MTERVENQRTTAEGQKGFGNTSSHPFSLTGRNDHRVGAHKFSGCQKKLRNPKK
jgi:hypothetical protein